VFDLLDFTLIPQHLGHATVIVGFVWIFYLTLLLMSDSITFSSILFATFMYILSFILYRIQLLSL